MPYPESAYLHLSGLRQFLFCRRQWALIHIGRQYEANRLFYNESPKTIKKWADQNAAPDKLFSVNMQIHSVEMGITGVCEAVRFVADSRGISLNGKKGLWTASPLLFNEWISDVDSIDELHLCAQAMCIEEMLCSHIAEALVVSIGRKKEIPILFTEEMRRIVRSSFEEMHGMMEKQYIPKVKMKRKCEECPMQEQCTPELSKSMPVLQYMKESMSDDF